LAIPRFLQTYQLHNSYCEFCAIAKILEITKKSRVLGRLSCSLQWILKFRMQCARNAFYLIANQTRDELSEAGALKLQSFTYWLVPGLFFVWPVFARRFSIKDWLKPFCTVHLKDVTGPARESCRQHFA